MGQSSSGAPNGQGMTQRREEETGDPKLDVTQDVPCAAQTRGELVMGRQLELFRYFQEQLARYRVYSNFPAGGSDVVGVSFQCLIDRDSEEVEEVLGVVTL